MCGNMEHAVAAVPSSHRPHRPSLWDERGIVDLSVSDPVEVPSVELSGVPDAFQAWYGTCVSQFRASAQRMQARKAQLTPPPGDFFSAPTALWDLMSPQGSAGATPVRLVRGSWLQARAALLAAATSKEERAALALPRRQDLEASDSDAFLSLEEVRKLPLGPFGKLRVLVLSYCWKGADHPDPDGEQLMRFAETLAREQDAALCTMQKGYSGARTESNKTGYEPKPFPLGEFGVFMDWASLHQKDGQGNRTDAEAAAFRYALERMQVWYGHLQTTVYVLASLPEGWSRSSYEESGWPTFEYSVASLVKQSSIHSWAPIVFVAGAELSRPPPLSTEGFEKHISTKVFTNGSDISMVCDLYDQTLLCSLGNGDELKYIDLKWGEEDAHKLAESLLLADAKTLNLYRNPIKDRGATSIAAALTCCALPGLQCIYLGKTGLGDGGAHAIANALESAFLTELLELWLNKNNIADAGVLAIARALNRNEHASPRLIKLELSENKFQEPAPLLSKRASLEVLV